MVECVQDLCKCRIGGVHLVEKHIFSEKENTDLNVFRCGSESCEPGHAVGLRVRDFHLVHLIVSGHGRFTIGRSVYELGPGDGFWIPAETLAGYEADRQDPWSYSWVGFHGIQADSAMRRAGLGSESPVFRWAGEPQCLAELEAMIAASGSGSVAELTRTGHLYLFLARLVDGLRRANPPKAGPAPQQRYVKQAIAYIARNYTSPLSVARMAVDLGVNRSHLTQVFTRTTGRSPQAFLIEWRMKRAEELLGGTDLTVSEVARSVGYDDPVQFSKRFRAHAGKSPAAFRKAGARMESDPG